MGKNPISHSISRATRKRFNRLRPSRGSLAATWRNHERVSLRRPPPPLYPWWLSLEREDFSLSFWWAGRVISPMGWLIEHRRATNSVVARWAILFRRKRTRRDGYVVRVVEITRKPQTIVEENWEENWRDCRRSHSSVFLEAIYRGRYFFFYAKLEYPRNGQRWNGIRHKYSIATWEFFSRKIGDFDKSSIFLSLRYIFFRKNSIVSLSLPCLLFFNIILYTLLLSFYYYQSHVILFWKMQRTFVNSNYSKIIM